MESNSPVKLSEEVTKAKADGIPTVLAEGNVTSPTAVVTIPTNV